MHLFADGQMPRLFDKDADGSGTNPPLKSLQILRNVPSLI